MPKGKNKPDWAVIHDDEEIRRRLEEFRTKQEKTGHRRHGARHSDSTRTRTIRALTVKQPWATMIADGLKTIETRTWPTNYRGPLLIVSARKPATAPAGCALAIASLVGCRPMVESDENAALCGYSPDLYAWELADVQRIDPPFDVRGRQRLYRVRVTSSLASLLQNR